MCSCIILFYSFIIREIRVYGAFILFHICELKLGLTPFLITFTLIYFIIPVLQKENISSIWNFQVIKSFNFSMWYGVQYVSDSYEF